MTNNDYVDEYSDTIERNLRYIQLYRKYFGDNPETGFGSSCNPLIPMTGDGEVSYGGEVSRDYNIIIVVPMCVIGNEETGFSTTCSGHTGYELLMQILIQEQAINSGHLYKRNAGYTSQTF